jgi:hypothetical protein
MMTMTNKCVLLPVLCLLPLLIRCAVAPLAGGSDNPDFLVVGTVVDTSGQPARNAVVTIVPALYNPVTDPAPAASMIDTTSANGAYRLAVTQKGGYSVQAVHLQQRTRLLITGITVAHDTTPVAAAALGVTGVVKVSLPTTGVNPVTGYVYIPGTTLCAFLNNRVDTVVLDSIPAGTLPMLSYAAINTTGSLALRYDIPVASGDTTVVLNPSWKYCRRIVLNTTATGANIAGNVAEFPVLVRLDGGKFDFSQARPDGADIRFTKGEGAPLPYEIEQWDPVTGFAEVWVKTDTVFGNDSNQRIMMYWGASVGSATSSMSNGAVVFDTSNGFIGVWHMNEDPSTGAGSIKDHTANAHNATPFGSMTASNSIEGTIGKALSFDGIDDFLNAGNVSIPGNYSVGLWVLLDTLGDYQRFIYKDSSYTLWYDKDSVSVRMEHFSTPTWWKGLLQDGGTRVPMTTGTWYYLIATFDGMAIRLYENGSEVSTSNAVTIYPRTNAIPLLFGQSRKNSFVNGIMDEIRIEGAMRSADWIGLCYMNQRIDDKLIQFK